MFSFAIQSVLNEMLPATFGVLYKLMPLWGFLFLLMFFWRAWVMYIRANFLSKQENALLEIKLPKEQYKSPLAMELILNTLSQKGGETTFIDRYIKGSVRAWFSLEIVSIEGDLHFFIWTRKKFADLIESQIYAQYPNSEIYEVGDYTNFLKYDKHAHSLWGCEFKLTKPDPYPIRTYIDYGLDKDRETKEEYKINPITSTLEFLGSMGKGEQVWLQILIRMTKKEKKKKGTFFKKTGWVEEGKELVNELMKRDLAAAGETAAIVKALTLLTKVEQETITAIERSLSKPGFDCGIRGIYIADTLKFRPINIIGLTGTFKQYSSNELNGFKPTGGLTIFDYPWQDFKDIRKNRVRNGLFDSYRRRAYFHPPYKRPHFVLNSEEIATIFHFPGSVAKTPTFKRIQSKKAEPPINLPI